MANRLTTIRSILTLSLSLIFLFNLFIESQALDVLVVLLMICLIILLIPVVTGSAKIIGYVSIGLSIFLFLIYQAPPKIWLDAFKENIYLVAMFTLVPLLKIPIQHGGYFTSLEKVFYRYVNTSSRFYVLASFLSAFIGVLINIAVVPLVYEICKASQFSNNKKLLSSAISRGFATCTIWAPTTAAIALILKLTGTKWVEFFPCALSCGILAGLTGFALTWYEERKNSIPSGIKVNKGDLAPVETVHLRKVLELSGFGLFLIVSIAIISYITGIQTINIVSLSALIFPFLWLALIKKLPIWAREFKHDYFPNSLPNVKNEAFLFVGAGLFAASINYSGLSQYIPRLLSVIVGHSGLILTFIIIFLNLILAIFGVHPIITITIIGSTIDPSYYNLSPTYLATVLAICWALGVSISPSSANVISIANLANQSPLIAGPRWNGLYVILSALGMILLLTLFRYLGLL